MERLDYFTVGKVLIKERTAQETSVAFIAVYAEVDWRLAGGGRKLETGGDAQSSLLDKQLIFS